MEQVQDRVVVGVSRHGVDSRHFASGYEQSPCRGRTVDICLVKGLDDERDAFCLGILVGAEPKDLDGAHDGRLSIWIVIQRCELVA